MKNVDFSFIPDDVIVIVFDNATKKGEELSFIKIIRKVCIAWKKIIERPNTLIMFIKRYKLDYKSDPSNHNDQSFRNLIETLKEQIKIFRANKQIKIIHIKVEENEFISKKDSRMLEEDDYLIFNDRRAFYGQVPISQKNLEPIDTITNDFFEKKNWY